MDIFSLILLCSLIFLAGFIDSIAGGGGLISLPAYLFVKLPMHNAMGCNKFSAAVGTTFSTLRFWKNKTLDLKVALISASGSSISSFIGSSIALLIEENILKIILIIILPIVAVLTLVKRDFGNEDKSFEIPMKKLYIFAFLLGLFIGFYDGLIGPGTGTFAIIAYCTIMKYDLKKASGNAKLLNLASNYASVVAYIMGGKIIYSIAIPAAISAMLGNYIGAGFAIKKGSKFIRPVMMLVMTLLFGKTIIDVFGAYFIK